MQGCLERRGLLTNARIKTSFALIKGSKLFFFVACMSEQFDYSVFCSGWFCLFEIDGAIAGGSIEAWGFVLCFPGERLKYVNTFLGKTKVC